jgi:hypothetical protein
MALVLYEGKAIAFGSSEEIFARVRAANNQRAPTTPAAPTAKTAPATQAAPAPAAKAARRAAIAEGV